MSRNSERSQLEEEEEEELELEEEEEELEEEEEEELEEESESESLDEDDEDDEESDEDEEEEEDEVESFRDFFFFSGCCAPPLPLPWFPPLRSCSVLEGLATYLRSFLHSYVQWPTCKHFWHFCEPSPWSFFIGGMYRFASMMAEVCQCRWVVVCWICGANFFSCLLVCPLCPRPTISSFFKIMYTINHTLSTLCCYLGIICHLPSLLLSSLGMYFM